MKITRRQLRTIIRESLQEGSFSDMDIEAMEQGTGPYAGVGPESDTKWDEGGWGSEGYELGYSQGLNGMAFEDEWEGDADYKAGYEKGYDEYRTEFAKSMLEPAWSPERDQEEWGDLDEGGFSDMDIGAMEQGTGRYRDPSALTHSQYAPEESAAFQRGVDDALEGFYEPSDVVPALLTFYEAGIEAGKDEAAEYGEVY